MKPLKIIGGLLLSIVFAVFTVTCTGKGPPANLPPPSPQTTSEPTNVSSSPSPSLPLRTLRDVPLMGGATRFDYQSFDPNTGRLYVAHLGDGTMVVFDTNKETLVGEVKDLPRVHGILAIPELHRVYASATGSNELAVIDDGTLQIIARAPAGDYPDGIAFARKANKIYVSDLHGKTDTVIDAKTNQRITTIALGGGDRRGTPGVFNPSSASTPSASHLSRRYNLSIGMSINNLLNHTNPGPIIGNITSPLFGHANQPSGGGGGGGGLGFSESANNRRLELQLRFSF